MKHHKGLWGCAQSGRLQKRIDGHALPMGIELGPGGHTVDVDLELRLRQALELLPAPFAQQSAAVLQCQAPAVQARGRCRPCRKHGKVAGQVLSGWKSIVSDRRPFATESSRDGWILHGPSLTSG